MSQDKDEKLSIVFQERYQVHVMVPLLGKGIFKVTIYARYVAIYRQ